MWKPLVMLGLITTSVVAADWDHDANIDAGVAELVASYKASGIPGMEQAVDACYGKITAADAFDDQLKRLEYCVGMDFAGFQLDRRDTPAERRVDTAFFSPANVKSRLDRVETYIRDPNIGNQVIRAWARASSDALSRMVPEQ